MEKDSSVKKELYKFGVEIQEVGGFMMYTISGGGFKTILNTILDKCKTTDKLKKIKLKPINVSTE